jgi:hypothetical protein
MKKITTILFILMLIQGVKTNGQRINEGIFLSATDFVNEKVSYANVGGEKYRLTVNRLFQPSSIKVHLDGKVISIKKDDVYGYRDKNGTIFRFIRQTPYKISNPGNELLLYSSTALIVGHRENHYVTSYFFSAGADAPVFPLSKWNLSLVLYKNINFLQLLNLYFQCDTDLTAFDNTNKIYLLNRVYEQSKSAMAN